MYAGDHPLYFDNTRGTIIECTMCNRVVYGNLLHLRIVHFANIHVVALSPCIKNHISAVFYGLSARNLLRRFIGQCTNIIMLYLENFLANV